MKLNDNFKVCQYSTIAQSLFNVFNNSLKVCSMPSHSVSKTKNSSRVSNTHIYVVQPCVQHLTIASDVCPLLNNSFRSASYTQHLCWSENNTSNNARLSPILHMGAFNTQHLFWSVSNAQ